jgi:hypothetical protein
MAIDANGVNLPNFGYRTKEDITASTLTTDINDSGKVLNFTHATPTVTLHAVAAGQNLTFRVGANPQTLTLDPDNADKFQGLDLAGADGATISLVNQPIGSYVSVQGGNSDGWIVTAASGVITAA